MEEDTIRITHFINPHMFWYKPVSAYVHNLEEKRFQLAIDEYCEEHFRESNAGEGRNDCEAFPGETVAVLDFDRNKWCRCVVDGVIEDDSGEKRYNLWAIDDGVPIQSSSCYVKPLPQKLSSEATSKVKRGAIKNVLPSEYIYDNRVDKLISKITPLWDSSASNVLQEIIRNSATIYLRNVTRHKVHSVQINFGDMEFVTRKNNVFYAALVLKDIRKASEVEPRDFITRLLEIQTMNANRCLANEGSENTKTSQNKPHIGSPMKVPSRYDRNGYTKISNGTAGEANIRELEMSGVVEEDFDESASMVRPNNVRERLRQVVEAIAENSHSEEELYPISSSRVKAGVNAEYERQLWQQRTRPPNHESFAKLNLSDHVEKPKSNGSNDRHSHANSKLDDSFEKPKSTVSFLSKLEMRKKLRVAQKTTVPEDADDKKPTPVHSSRYDTLNIVPAGFNMGNVAFDNGKVVAGGDSSDSSERKAKKSTSPSFNLRQPSAANQYKDRHTSSDELNANTNGKPYNGYDPSNGRVYKSKNTSRFDQLIEEEACIKSRLCHQRVLVHGKRIPKPIENLESANFCPEVHHQLSTLNFRSIYRIQTYAWPHILRGNSFFCVNSSATGKTFAYLPAVCSLVMKMHDEELVPKGAGPVAIIVCKSSREVQRVASYCKKMLNSSMNKAMAVVEAFGAKDIPKSCNLLLNGCAVLVVTAPGYRRVYENMPNAFVKERVQCVVIDNIDSIIERYSSELQLICKNCDKAELQMVVTATYWNPLFFGFLKKYKNTIICIGAYLEAAIYGKSNLVLQLKSQDMKIQEIVNFVKKNNYQNERTLVVCSDPSEVHEIVELLKSQSITHMYCNEKTTLTTMGGFKEWDSQMPGDMHVLVIYDGILPDLEICKAQHIIHFSLPHLWTSFTRRFACSFGYYKDPLREDTSACKPSSSLVLLDENNNEQLPKLVEFLRIHNHEVAEPIVNLANNLRIQQEEQKLSIGNPVDFCSQVLDFGKCRSANCMKRHVFTTKDLAIGGMPSSGIIKMKIYNLFSPTHYTARILEHRDYGATSWTTVNDAQDFFALDIEMQQHYSNDERHRSHGDAHYNDWCVIFDEHRYWRCRVVSIDQRKELSTNRKVKVKLLDVGRTIDCVSSELLYIPESFCQLPAQAVDIRIVGVVPHDFETEWDKRVTVTIKEWIDKYTTNDKFHVEGKVLLSIRDTVWVDTIRLVEHLSGLNAEIHEIHVKSEIIGKNFGVTDKEPLMLLTQMVVNCEAYRKRNIPIKQELMSDDENIDKDEQNVESEVNSDSDKFFRVDKKCKEIDKPIKPTVILKPIELSSTDSDDCISVVATETDGVPENVTASNVKEVVQETIENLIQTTKPRARNFREVYDELEEETTYEVFISQYYAPDDFYVCQVEKFSFISSMIGNLTESETSLVPMEDVQVGDFCLVLYDNAYQRAKVTEIEGRDICVFFLDLGGYDTYGSIDLFELPDDILKALPFCAIKSGVACLQPKDNETGFWSPDIGDQIYDKVLANYRTFSAKVIETIKNPHVETLVSCKCYRLLLFDPEHELESWIFDEIVEFKLARYIEEERPYAIDINFGDDDFRHFLDPNAPVPKKAINGDDFEATIEEVVEPVPQVPILAETKPQKKPSKLTLLKQRLRKKKPSNAIAYPRLKCDFRSPKTIWRQDESLIVIRIAAPENVQYNLTMLSDSLKLSYLHDEEKYLLSIVLFATVSPQYATHEVRGLSIVVRLMKLVPTMQWPSLMRHGDKVPWLQQCIEIPNSDETDGTDGMHRALPTVPNLEASSDSLSDEPDFSDNFDRFDPIEDDYFLRDD